MTTTMIHQPAARAVMLPVQRGPVAHAHEAQVRLGQASTPRDLGPDQLVDGDLCEIATGRRYCHVSGATLAVDADGSERVLCEHHRSLYFPQAA